MKKALPSIEDHCFLKRDIQLQSDEKPSSAEGRALRCSFEVEVPSFQDECGCAFAGHGHAGYNESIGAGGQGERLTLPPSMKRSTEDPGGIQIAYWIEAVVIRKGLFKRNERAKVELPIAISRNLPPSYGHESVVSTSGRRALTFKSSEQGSLVELEAELSFTTPSEVAPTILPVNLTYRLISSSSSSSHNPPPPTSMLHHLRSSSNLKMTLGLARRCATRPISRPGNGEEFRWAAARVSSGSLEELKEGDENSVRLRGEVKVPEGAITVMSCGAEVEYSIHVNISSSLLTQTLTLSSRVFLPSATDDDADPRS